MSEEKYSNREIDGFLKRQEDAHNSFMIVLNDIKTQTTKTNGRVTRLERICLIVGVAGATYALINYPQVISVIKLFI